MKASNLRILFWVAVTACSPSFGQTNFVYDQQSAFEGAAREGGGVITTSQPFGQSFTPSLDSIGFIRLWLDDLHPGNGTGSVVYVNLLTNSIAGPVLASTLSLSLPDSIGPGNTNPGYADFFFSNAVSVSPGAAYYIQPLLQGGDAVGVAGDVSYQYTGGIMYIQGSARPLQDLWFREGVITVPEPSVVALGVVGVAGWLGWQVRRRVRHARKA